MAMMWAFIVAVCVAAALMLSCTFTAWPQPVCQLFH